MRHIKGFKQLSRNHSHRKALYKNMAEALFKNERIMTTKEKAREIRRITEKMITKAKEKTLHNIRVINKLIKNKAILMKLFDEIAPRYKERKGGYTRIIKLNKRKGDGASMAYLELIGEANEQRKKKKVKKVAKENKPDNKEKIEKQETKKQEIKKDEIPKKVKPTKKVDIKETKKIEEGNKENLENKKEDGIKTEEKNEVVKITKGKKGK